MKENNLYFRNVMIQFAREDLWVMDFVHSWPGSKDWNNLKPQFDSTFTSTSTEVKNIMKEFESLYPCDNRQDEDSESELSIK